MQGLKTKTLRKWSGWGEGYKYKRPLLVQFHERNIKNIVMENLRRLREAQPPFNDIVVNHDMTKSEREDVKKMVKTAEERQKNEGQGEWIFRVRGSQETWQLWSWRKEHECALYNADSLLNKMCELEHIINHDTQKPLIIAVTECKAKTKTSCNVAEYQLQVTICSIIWMIVV